MVFYSAGLVLAITFTLSCSSDDPDNNSDGNAVPSPSINTNGDQTYKVDGEQVYILSTSAIPQLLYTSSADVVVDKLNFATDDIILAGRIENGKLSLDFPNIDHYYFNNDDIPRDFDEVGLSVNGCKLYLLGSTKGLVQLTPQTYGNDMKAMGVFLYTLVSGEFIASGGTNFNLKKGWNLGYVLLPDMSVSVAPPSGLKWEWGLNCDDD